MKLCSSPSTVLLVSLLSIVAGQDCPDGYSFLTTTPGSLSGCYLSQEWGDQDNMLAPPDCPSGGTRVVDPDAIASIFESDDVNSLDDCMHGADGCTHGTKSGSAVGSSRGQAGTSFSSDGITMVYYDPFEKGFVAELFPLNRVFAPSVFQVCKVDATANPTAFGDPHIQTWTGQSYDFMGECDLVLAQSDNFGHGMGFEMQVRTKIRSTYSFISDVAVKIGSDILEVSSDGSYLWNGEQGVDLLCDHKALSGIYPLTWRMSYLENVKHKTKQFIINLGAMGEVNINVRPEHSFIDVKLMDAHVEAFGDSVGLMGSYAGKLLGRDGTEIIPTPHVDENTPHHEGHSYDAFAMEWQVNDKDTMLFHDIGTGPQFPEACKLPEHPQSLDNRRLSSKVDFLKKAEEACSGISNDEKKKDACLYDVLATGDLDVAAYLVGF